MSKPRQQSRDALSRRRVLQGLAATGAATALGGFPAIARSAPSQLIVATGGGKLEDAYKQTNFKTFTAETGIPITTTSNPVAKLKAMVEQKAVEWDVMQTAAEAAAVLARQGLLEPIDYSVIDKSSMLPGTAHEYYVLTDVAAYHIAWNTDNVQAADAPADWAAFWSSKGRKGLWKRPFQTMEAALLADGVAKDALYPLDVDRALASLDRIKDSLLWWDKGAQSAQILLDGEVEVSSTWNGRVHAPKLAGAPVDYHFNGAVFVFDAFVVPRGAPNVKESMQLLATTLRADVQAAYSQVIPYGPTNTEALAMIPADVLKNLPSSEENFGKGVVLDLDWWAENGDATGETFNKYVLG